ncbi:hypothetical protein AB0M92_18810 [Streptomyces sp. NPDC051582]|uniref:hypothetical protein n=1 Tax=Streptomyces sp. NPDC051582 TaxID=3155167 RepID=UPI003437F338
MGPWEWFLIFAVCGLIAAAAWHWNRSDDSRGYRATWQESTRSEDDVRADVSSWRQRREPAIETEAGDPYSDDRITAELIFIPQQRTEESR